MAKSRSGLGLGLVRLAKAGEPPVTRRRERDGMFMAHVTRLLSVPDATEREELAAFAARVAQLDATSLVRLRQADDQVVAWAQTPFEVLVTRSAPAQVHPADLTVRAHDLLAALAIARDEQVDPGSPMDAQWHSELPPANGWRVVATLPANELEALVQRAIAQAREREVTPDGLPPRELLDQPAHTVTEGETRVPVPMRCLFALSGMGLLGGPTTGEPPEEVRVSATEAWLRLDTQRGAAVRRRRALLPLLVGGL